MGGQDSDQFSQFTLASRLFRKSGLKANEANEFTELMGNMASANIVSQFLSKMDSFEATVRAELKSQKESQEAKLDAVSSKYTLLIWVIGFATVILSAVILFSDAG